MDKLRIDKWLWAARFYKTRSIAAQAVQGGKVHVNGQRVKPAHPVKPDDRISITSGLYEMVIIVEQLSDRRGKAEQARQLYAETDESRQKREQLQLQNRATGQYLESPDKRPDKRQRRSLMRIRRNQ